MTLSSLSNFITTHLGLMKAWATCNSLDWVTCYPLHFTLAYIVYRESRTVKLFTYMYIMASARKSDCPRSWKIGSGGLFKIHAVWTVYASFITFITYDPQNFKMTPTWFIKRVTMTLKVKMQGQTLQMHFRKEQTNYTSFLMNYLIIQLLPMIQEWYRVCVENAVLMPWLSH